MSTLGELARKAFRDAVEMFPWESKTQKEGYLGLVQYKMRSGQMPTSDIDLDMAFLIQKNHEAGLYFTELVADQIGKLQDEIMQLREQIREMKSWANSLEK